MNTATPEFPTISVVMPLYNKEREVLRAISSVLSQTFCDFELIIVNDGSTDDSAEVVRSIKDPRVRLFTQTNAGVSAARNHGIEKSFSSIIAFVDADDQWEPEFLDRVVDLKKCFVDADVFATNYFYCNQEGKRRAASVNGLPNNFSAGILANYFKVALISDPPLWTSAVAVNKNAIESIGGFPLGVDAGEDLLTWARLAARYEIAYSIKPLAVYWNPETIKERSSRLPQDPDMVGKGLLALIDENPSKKDLIRKYLSHWYRMRANIYIQLGDRANAIEEINKSIRLSPLNFILYVYFFMALLPKSIFLNTRRWFNYLRN